MTNILVTGGAGYIGSATSLLLSRLGYTVVLYDNLSTGANQSGLKNELVVGDILDYDRVLAALRDHHIDAVVHFAAKAYVGESVARPAYYYENNVSGTLALLRAMVTAGVGKLVVSSSCAVYGDQGDAPISEEAPLQPINPYGASKAMMERLCRDIGDAHGVRYLSLRYFNAAGTEGSYTVGELHWPETHVLPLMLMASSGETADFVGYGNDYATPDGSCIRDFTHVEDIAAGHELALSYLFDGGPSRALNLGSGRGTSVAQLADVVREVSGSDFAVTWKGRRRGDPAVLVADHKRASDILGWEPKYSDIETIVQSAWRWHQDRASAHRSAICHRG